MGHEFAGRVEAVGSDVTSFEIGDRVFGFIGFSGPFGADAEYVTIPEGGPLATILANLTYEEAAPSTEGSHYALANSRKARIRSADRVIDYTAEDFTKDDQEYEAVFGAVGKSSFGRCRRLLKPGGIYLLTEGSPVPDLGLITPLFGGKKVMFALPKLDQATVGHFKELIESGQFKRLIDRPYRLDQIIEASKYVDTGQEIGNVVISVEPQN